MDEKLISAAQAEMASSDVEVSGMTLAEVLLARRWVNEQTLARIAPWLKDTHAAPAVVTASEDKDQNSHGDSVYQQNLKRYRQLMHKILDETE
ncbi:hypothetical protein BH10CYA1_BH10CYA1_17020 [soil metagenome]